MKTAPLILVAGGTGSGKTHLIDRMLAANPGLRCAALVDSPGNAAIDCAAIGRGVVVPLMQGAIILRSFPRDLDRVVTRYAPDAIVVELRAGIDLSGLLGRLYRTRAVLMGVIAVIAPSGAALDENDAAALPLADLVVVNDGAPGAGDPGGIVARAREINPRAEILSGGSLPSMDSMMNGPRYDIAARLRACGCDGPTGGAALRDDSGSHAIDFFDGRWVEIDALRSLLASPPVPLEAAKGFVCLQPDGRRYRFYHRNDTFILQEAAPFPDAQVETADWMHRHDHDHDDCDCEPMETDEGSDSLAEFSAITFTVGCDDAGVVDAELAMAQAMERCWEYPDAGPRAGAPDDGTIETIANLMHDEKFIEAASLVQECLRSCAEIPSSLYGFLAEIYDALGMPYRALTLARCACIAGSPSVETLERLARAYNAVDDCARAVTVLDRCLALDPEFISGLLNQARLNFAYDRLDRARNALERARAMDPDNPDAIMLAGQIADESGDPGGAREEFERLAAAAPDDAEIAFRLASACNDCDDLDAALHAQRRAAEADPDDAYARYCCGFIALRAGDDADALEWLEQAREGGFTNSRLFLCAGIAHTRLDEPDDAALRFADARDAAMDALNDDPFVDSLIEQAILAHIAVGETDDARRHAALLAADPAFAFSREFGQFCRMMDTFPLAHELLRMSES